MTGLVGLDCMAHIRASPCRGSQISRLHLLSPRRGPSHRPFRLHVRVTSQVKTATRDAPGLQTMPWTGSKEQHAVRFSSDYLVCITYDVSVHQPSCVAHVGCTQLRCFRNAARAMNARLYKPLICSGASVVFHAGTASIAAAHAKLPGRSARCRYTAVVPA